MSSLFFPLYSLISLLFLMEDIFISLWRIFYFVMEDKLIFYVSHGGYFIMSTMFSYAYATLVAYILFLLFREGHDIKCISRTYGR